MSVTEYAPVPATRAHTGEGKSEEEKMQEWMGWWWGQTFHTDWPLSSKPSWEHEGYVGERLCPKIHGPVFFQIRHGSFQLITWVLKRLVHVWVSVYQSIYLICVFLFQLASCWKSCCSSCPRVVCWRVLPCTSFSSRSWAVCPSHLHAALSMPTSALLSRYVARLNTV